MERGGVSAPKRLGPARRTHLQVTLSVKAPPRRGPITDEIPTTEVELSISCIITLGGRTKDCAKEAQELGALFQSRDFGTVDTPVG